MIDEVITDKVGPEKLHDLLRRWKQSRFARSSKNQYNCSLNQFEKWLGREATTEDVTAENISKFIQWRLEHWKAATARKDRIHLLRFWRWLYERKAVAGPPKGVKPVPKTKTAKKDPASHSMPPTDVPLAETALIVRPKEVALPTLIEPISDSNPLLTDILDRYAADQLDFTDRSKREYMTTVRALEKWLERPATVTDFNDETLQGFIAARFKERAAPTVKKDRQQILALWRWTWRKKLTETQPRDVPRIPLKLREPKAHKPRDLEKILEACARMEPCEGWDGRHWEALIRVCYDSAERISAVMGTPLSALDPEAQTLRIPGDVRKRGHDHVASLRKDTLTAIARLPRPRRELLFEFPGCYLTLLRHFKKLARMAGLKLQKGMAFHAIRKTSFTLVWEEHGAHVAMRHCGHQSDLSRHYLDRSLLTKRRVADSLPELKTATPFETKWEAIQQRYNRREFAERLGICWASFEKLFREDLLPRPSHSVPEVSWERNVVDEWIEAGCPAPVDGEWTAPEPVIEVPPEDKLAQLIGKLGEAERQSLMVLAERLCKA